jgi:hypothetical protein
MYTNGATIPPHPPSWGLKILSPSTSGYRQCHGSKKIGNIFEIRNYSLGGEVNLKSNSCPHLRLGFANEQFDGMTFHRADMFVDRLSIGQLINGWFISSEASRLDMADVVLALWCPTFTGAILEDSMTSQTGQLHIIINIDSIIRIVRQHLSVNQFEVE